MAVQVSYPGVYIREQSSGAQAVAAVPTAITAFVGMTKRGRLGHPTRISNRGAFESEFGLDADRGDMPDQVNAFYTNGGGLCYVVRIAENAAQATVDLNDEAGRPTLRLTTRDHGADGNLIRAEVSYPSASLFNLRLYRRRVGAGGDVEIADEEGFDNLSMDPASGRFATTIVDAGSALVTAETIFQAADVAAQSVSIAGLILPSTGGANLLAALERRFRVLPSGARGNGALAISVDHQRPIVVTVDPPTSDAEADAFPGALQAAINGRLLAEGLAGDVTVTLLGVADSVPGGSLLRIERAGGSVAVTPAPLNDIAGSFFFGADSGGIEIDRHAGLRPAPTGAFARIHGAGTDLALLRGFADTERNQLTGFNLTDASGDPPHAVPASGLGFASALAGERMYQGTRFVPAGGDTSLGAFVNVIENLAALAAAIEANSNRRWRASVQGLRLVLTPSFGGSDSDPTARLTTQGGADIGVAGPAGMFDPALSQSAYNVAAYSLGTTGGAPGVGPYQAGANPGSDGTIPTIDRYRAAFQRLERDVDLFNLMVLPRANDGTNRQTDGDRAVIWGEASAFCARERAFLLVDPPSDPGSGWSTVDDAVAGADTLRIGVAIRNAAVYWPRLRLNGRMLDPSGAIAGLMARTDSNRGVWKAPAGIEATLRGVRGVEHSMSDADNGLINPLAVNAIRVFPTGVVSWGARTLIGNDRSGNIDDKYVPVRRTMLFIEESLYRGLHFAVFEPNDEPLWARLRLAAGSFMNGLFRQGAFAGAKASDAYFVRCDETTTTETDRNLGIVNVVVAFAPLKPAEFVVITIRQIAGQTQV